jgi:hypothetical protein
VLRWDVLACAQGCHLAAGVDAARWCFSRLSGVCRAWPRVKTRQQDRQNAGQEYAVKSSPMPSTDLS